MKLLKDINKYYLLCQTAVRHDMAKRIMHSVLPSVADENQTILTGGNVDYNSLKYAIEGRKDIIKYGVKSAIEELRHFIKQEGYQSPYYLAMTDFEAGAYQKAIEEAISAFSIKSGWMKGYGGEAWNNVAKSLLKLIKLDKELDLVRKQKETDQSAIEKEVQIMQMLVVELNIFDGLSHNTASIMHNVLEEENADKSNDLQGLEFNKTRRLMDAKELANPIDVFKEIEQTLIESGDINKYKDYTTKLRNHPEYRKTNKKLEDEIFKIRFRKTTNKIIESYNNLISDLGLLSNDIKNDKLDYVKSINKKTYSSAIYKIIDDAKDQLSSSIFFIERINEENSDNNVPSSDFIMSVEKGLSTFDKQLSAIRNKYTLWDKVEDVFDENGSLDDKLKQLVLNNITGLKSLMRKILYFIESI